MSVFSAQKKLKINHLDLPKLHFILTMMLNCNKQQFSLYQIKSPRFYLNCCCSYVTFKIPLMSQSPAFQTVLSVPKCGCSWWIQRWVHKLAYALDCTYLQKYTDYTAISMILKRKVVFGHLGLHTEPWVRWGWLRLRGVDIARDRFETSGLGAGARSRGIGNLQELYSCVLLCLSLEPTIWSINSMKIFLFVIM